MQKVRQKFAYVKNLPYLCTQIGEVMKKMYNTPIIEVTAVETARLMGDPLLGSGTAPETAPARRSVAPPVPGDNL